MCQTSPVRWECGNCGAANGKKTKHCRLCGLPPPPQAPPAAPENQLVLDSQDSAAGTPFRPLPPARPADDESDFSFEKTMVAGGASSDGDDVIPSRRKGATGQRSCAGSPGAKRRKTADTYSPAGPAEGARALKEADADSDSTASGGSGSQDDESRGTAVFCDTDDETLESGSGSSSTSRAVPLGGSAAKGAVKPAAKGAVKPAAKGAVKPAAKKAALKPAAKKSAAKPAAKKTTARDAVAPASCDHGAPVGTGVSARRGPPLNGRTYGTRLPTRGPAGPAARPTGTRAAPKPGMLPKPRLRCGLSRPPPRPDD
eukprot:TRINITY_DN4990_c0_g2_i2.p2 TRINITY_DN4990_c0_g2~~TRINITY_DN4990_c0_g2_i2.p2  ORF type:complete len:314 (+),score=47.58 TRINITY_DN4990_c0_g2_i2:795-1736(+)